MPIVNEYQRIVGQLDLLLAEVAMRPAVASESRYYLQNIGAVRSVDDFLHDNHLFRYALTAFEMQDLIDGREFVRRILGVGICGNNSFALQLTDSRFRDFATCFDFKRLGAATTDRQVVKQPVVDRYVRVEFETIAGAADESLRLALYFRRKAPLVSSVYGLMSDAALYAVVEAALGFPAGCRRHEVSMQSLIAAQLDVNNLKDPVALDAFIGRFVANWPHTAFDAATRAPEVGLGRAPLAAMSSAALLSLQGLKLGGSH